MALTMRRIEKIYFELLKERRAVCALLLIFGSAHLASAMHFFILGKAMNGARALLLLFILLLLPIAEEALRVRTPLLGYALILFLIFGSLLGSCYNFYFRISHWDTLLHVLSGIAFACIGYAICKLLFSKTLFKNKNHIRMIIFADYTAGMDFHHSPKNYLFFIY